MRQRTFSERACTRSTGSGSKMQRWGMIIHGQARDSKKSPYNWCTSRTTRNKLNCWNRKTTNTSLSRINSLSLIKTPLESSLQNTMVRDWQWPQLSSFRQEEWSAEVPRDVREQGGIDQRNRLRPRSRYRASSLWTWGPLQPRERNSWRRWLDAKGVGIDSRIVKLHSSNSYQH